ncbi:hypothetical protein BHE74_00038810 [Ensete ventricosum]|nr:hypothetical protein GW17_00033724 [Ensete ventricosum]RWW54597.1 hypothetical protein BHE74_00038810 [Ensete ventricosum]
MVSGCRPSNPEVGTSGSSSGVTTSMDIKALMALGIMVYHVFDSILIVKCLVMIWECYSILYEYALHAPLLGSNHMTQYLNGFSVSIDALKVGLWFLLHP